MKTRILADLERLATQCGAVINEGGADFSDDVSCAVAVLAVVEHMIDAVKNDKPVIPEKVGAAPCG